MLKICEDPVFGFVQHICLDDCRPSVWVALVAGKNHDGCEDWLAQYSDPSPQSSQIAVSPKKKKPFGMIPSTNRKFSDRNPPAPKVLGRDLPDGTRKRLQVYLGGGAIFRPKPPVFDRSWRSPSKNTVKNSTEDTCSWTRPSKIGKRKVKKPRVFQLFDFNFLVCNIFFCGSAGGLARRRIFEFLDPFSDWFSSFCDSRNTGFYSVFLFSACLTASFKTSKNLVNYAVLCYGVNENIVNTSVFWRWLKKHCKLQCFWPPDPQKPWYLQWFLLLTAQKHCK